MKSCAECVKIRKRSGQRALSPGTSIVWVVRNIPTKVNQEIASEIGEKLREAQGHLSQIFTMRT